MPNGERRMDFEEVEKLFEKLKDEDQIVSLIWKRILSDQITKEHGLMMMVCNLAEEKKELQNNFGILSNKIEKVFKNVVPV